MCILDLVDTLRGEFSACNAVALTDLSTGMALCSSTQTKLPQEQMDQLCDTALHLLAGDIPSLLRRNVRQAIIVEGSAVELFLRGPGKESEALCCSCSADIDTPRLSAAAHRLLTEIAGAG